MERQPAPAAVHFVIDQITLHGFSAGQKRRFLDALQVQLMALGQTGELHPATGRQQVTDRVAAALHTATGRPR